jgi:SAM-dependent methyltransferase
MVKETKQLKIDLGCGPNKKEGFYGVDSMKFKGVDKVADLTKKWPFKDNSVDEAHASHVVEHFDAKDRIHFANELYRVLKKGAKATIIVPHWASMRAYGDLTHKWPPISEFWFYYLSTEWRKVNAPHNTGYKCDFDVTWGYSMRQDLAVRNQEYQQFAMANHKEACQDTIATFVKK